MLIHQLVVYKALAAAGADELHQKQEVLDTHMHVHGRHLVVAFHATPSSLSFEGDAVVAVQHGAVPVVALLSFLDDALANLAQEVVDDMLQRSGLKVGIVHAHNLIHCTCILKIII